VGYSLSKRHNAQVQASDWQVLDMLPHHRGITKWCGGGKERRLPLKQLHQMHRIGLYMPERTSYKQRSRLPDDNSSIVSWIIDGMNQSHTWQNLSSYRIHCCSLLIFDRADRLSSPPPPATDNQALTEVISLRDSSGKFH
jgi:hypothetical protein